MGSTTAAAVASDEAAAHDATKNGAAGHEQGSRDLSTDAIFKILAERERQDDEMRAVVDAKIAYHEAELKRLGEVRAKLAPPASPLVESIVASLATKDGPLHEPIEAGASPEPTTRGMQILRFLARQTKLVSTREIADGIGLGDRFTHVRQTLYDMDRKSGVVQRVGRGMWRISPKGKQEANA